MLISKNLKRILIIVLILLVIAVTTFCVWNFFRPSYNDIDLENFKSADAKLGYDGNIITSKNNHLYIINTKTREIHEVFIRSNWVDSMTSDNVIVYSNIDTKTGICHYDPSDGTILNNQEIISDNLLRIDPSIVRLNDTYFLSTTLVVGPINLADTNNYNGYYQIQLYKSSDLINWEYVTDIFSAYQNLEDAELDTQGDQLRLTFEQETVDKGPSIIQTMYSDDYGQSWTDPVTLVENGADNEPASLIKTKGEYWLFYSSDINSVGGSYESAEAYVLRLNDNLEPIETRKIPLNTNQILLYEALIEGDKLTLLYAHDYLNNDDLVLKNLDLNSVLEDSS